jgi:hypothetical protein
MFQLILHHPYTHVPEAIDISGAGNHGVVRRPDVGFTPDGASVGSGALTFDLPTSRVSVPRTPVFQHLQALKIETIVRLRSLGDRRNLVEGEHSFAFFIQPDGTLWGTALGRQTPGGPLDWFGANSAPTGGGIVPLNQWVKLTYIHDGFATIRLYIDGQLVAINSSLHSPIRPVGPRGIHIGNWPPDDAYTFAGDIDDVRIWRWDPDAAYYQFFCRQPAGCWKQIVTDLGRWARGPEGQRRLRSLILCVGTAQTELIRAVRGQGEEAIRANEEFARRYRDLWCKGPIDGDEMKQLLEEWLRWLRFVVGRERLANFLRQMTLCFKHNEFLEKNQAGAGLEKCDPAFVGFIKVLMEMDLT